MSIKQWISPNIHTDRVACNMGGKRNEGSIGVIISSLPSVSYDMIFSLGGLIRHSPVTISSSVIHERSSGGDTACISNIVDAFSDSDGRNRDGSPVMQQ